METASLGSKCIGTSSPAEDVPGNCPCPILQEHNACVLVCMYTFNFPRVHTYDIHIHMFIFLCIITYIHVCMHACMHVWIYVDLNAHLCVDPFVCMNVDLEGKCLLLPFKAPFSASAGFGWPTRRPCGQPYAQAACSGLEPRGFKSTN